MSDGSENMSSWNELKPRAVASARWGLPRRGVNDLELVVDARDGYGDAHALDSTQSMIGSTDVKSGRVKLTLT